MNVEKQILSWNDHDPDNYYDIVEVYIIEDIRYILTFYLTFDIIFFWHILRHSLWHLF